MLSNKVDPTALAIFCKVIDNFGDIGICWRLARQLQHEHGISVTLWTDDLQTFLKICPEVGVHLQTQLLAGVTVRQWPSHERTFAKTDIPDIVIEFFGCDIPPNYILAMAERKPQPVWLNLEGLTAEEWVEGCHTLPSPHPRLPLTKYFFYPGFTDKTGGLLYESALEEERRKFQADPTAMMAFLEKLDVSPAEIASFKVSLFCYPHAPVNALLDAWQGSETAVTCLVPEGVAVEPIQAFLGAEAIPGAVKSRGALTVRVLPFVSQQDYDRVLWACDLNVVRGEDSFVRGQWAGKPFIWHIYSQDENLHHKKLRAFLQRYVGADPSAMESWTTFSLNWNGVGTEDPTDWPAVWRQFRSDLPEIARRSGQWRQQMQANGDLAGNLLKFAGSIGKQNQA